MSLLWHDPVVTRVSENVPFPAAAGQTLSGKPWNFGGNGVLLGAFSLLAQSELGVWMRLLDDAKIPFSVLLIAPDWAARRNDAILTFPPSQRDRVILVTDVGNKWSTLINADSLDRAFAAFVEKGTAQPLMVGAPTEDAWDRFQAACKI
jgi:hypothetical protein